MTAERFLELKNLLRTNRFGGSVNAVCRRPKATDYGEKTLTSFSVPSVSPLRGRVFINMQNWRFILGASCLLAASLASSAELTIEIGSQRSPSTIRAQMDAHVRQFAKNASHLTSRIRTTLSRGNRWDARIPFSLPSRVQLTQNGQPIAAERSPFGDGPGLSLVFDSSGTGSFPPLYRQLLEDVFSQSESTLNAVFGAPNTSVVHVRNFDATIGDRDAVAGGYFVPNNGSGEMEIRFPVYSNNEAAAVNFVHCLLLAYQGDESYSFDAFREGLVRAATMRVVRTAGAMPAGLDPSLIEAALDNTYDVGTFYDLYNQRALQSTQFIAPNLRDTQLPIGGSVGGLYLLRYQMAGTAWQKVLTEYPAFAATLNGQLYAQPSLAGDIPALIAQSQSVINTLAGSGSATIEGLSFSSWYQRQFGIRVGEVKGNRLLVQPVPLPPETGTSDFGVVDVVAHWFETGNSGNEVLLSGVSFPIFWNDAFDRVFPSTQEDRLDIAGAYGSVTPNLPNLYSGTPYRTTIDIPVQDRIARAYFPAGAIATGSNPTPNDLFGTVVGFPNDANLKLRFTYGATVVNNIPIQRGAFGFRVNTTPYLGSARCRAEVIRTVNTVETVVIDRFLNKGPGPLCIDLRKDNGDGSQSFTTIPKGLSTVGLHVDPYESQPSDILGLTAANVLAARWNGAKLKYEIWPDLGAFLQGNGYFVRMPAATTITVPGRTHGGVGVSVALRPGWNLISNPLPETVPTANVSVIKAADALRTWTESLGVELGPLFFEFAPGPNDAATGAPETGTMVSATTFEPGKAYFVRVLNAEGLTLLFEGTPPQRPGTLSPMSPPPIGPPRWLMSISASKDGFRTQAEIGQSLTATLGLDPREDSPLPPSVGGLQATSLAAGGLYRDVRSSTVASTYKVRFSGMEAGKMYRFQTASQIGTVPRYRWRLEGMSRWNYASGSLQFDLRVPRSTMTLEFRMEGVDR